MATATSFDALEHTSDGGFAPVRLSFVGSEDEGWTVERNRAAWLDLSAGHRLLRTTHCGVCSTDLDRRFLPFPLPQVIGHEVVARDASGQRCVVEITDRDVPAAVAAAMGQVVADRSGAEEGAAAEVPAADVPASAEPPGEPPTTP